MTEKNILNGLLKIIEEKDNKVLNSPLTIAYYFHGLYSRYLWRTLRMYIYEDCLDMDNVLDSPKETKF